MFVVVYLLLLGMGMGPLPMQPRASFNSCEYLKTMMRTTNDGSSVSGSKGGTNDIIRIFQVPLASVRADGLFVSPGLRIADFCTRKGSCNSHAKNG